MTSKDQKPDGYQFKDIILSHNFGNCATRSELSTQVTDFTGKVHESPIILSNMVCCQSAKILKVFNSLKWPYVYHRTSGNQILFVNRIIKENWHLKSISVGVNEQELEMLKCIKTNYGGKALDWLTVDVAFIYNQKHQDFIKEVRKMFPDVYLIAGNFTTPETVKWLADLGVNAGKFGISTSLLCRTGQYTGFASCATDLLDCANEANLTPNGFDLIQDGGVTVLNESTGECAYGDIFKALNFGAKWVMSSALFRWCSEMADDGGNVLQYGNSTEKAKGHSRNVEGAVKTFKTNEISAKTQMQIIKEHLQSSMSYAGIQDLKNAYMSCKWRVLN